MLVTIAEAAQRLEITENAIRCRIKRGSMKATRDGGRVRVEISQADQGPTMETLQEEIRGLQARLEEETRKADRLLQVVEREQTLRQQLQHHLDTLTSVLALPPPAGEAGAIRSPLIANIRRRRRSA